MPGPHGDNWNEQERKLDAALCNFCNSASDPWNPPSKWDDEVWRNFGQLCKSYNEWWKSKQETNA